MIQDLPYSSYLSKTHERTEEHAMPGLPQVLLIALLSVLSPYGPATAAETLTMNTPGNPPYHYAEQDGIMDLWMQDVFQRVGKKVVLNWLPPERSLMLANEGMADGDAVRIGGLSKEYPNLIQVPEPVYVGDFVSFVKGVEFIPNGWKSLCPYHVATVRGHKITELNVKGTKSHVQVKKLDQLFTLLDKRRVDVVVVERLFGEVNIKQRGLQEIRLLEPPLARVSFYLYMHKKHAPTIPEISEAIMQMKKDGTHQQIYEAARRKLGF
ncbi:MAG: hypothetical protein C4576_34655 [Desulfobacteraceae bacterium]|nr:MAG: hypothetical protein C4576_34655 [Desulfobacteraceae bacterium]